MQLYLKRDYLYRKPVPGAPLRVAFVGQSTYFRGCSLEDPAAGIKPFFIDFRAGADGQHLLSQLKEVSPHVVIVFRPEIIPYRLFAHLRALTIGFLTEPLPRSDGEEHDDLQTRLGYLKEIDPNNFDRVIAFDPHIAETVQRVVGFDIWRSLPIPVSDRLYRPISRRPGPQRVIFIGRSTDHREFFLMPLKHDFDVLHVAHGVEGEELSKLLADTDIAINLHNEPYPNFENRVCIHLAAGQFLISEPLSPTHGLEPGIDFYEVHDPQELASVVHNAIHHPDSFFRVRARGRMKVEEFRASRVYPRVLRDAILDVDAFGTRRHMWVEPDSTVLTLS